MIIKVGNYPFLFNTLLLILVTTIHSAHGSISQRCHALNNWMDTNEDCSNSAELFTSSHLPLFQQYPHLVGTIPYLNLANLPTPVTKLNKVGKVINHEHLFFKNDAETGTLFGGNKIRKLGFLLGWAKRHKAELILTCGGAGSNHTTATISCACAIDIPCEVFLSEQLPTSYARRNLLLSALYGGMLNIYPTFNDRQQAILDRAATCGKKVFYISAGGSTARGSLGYVNAAFELVEQIRKEELPEPDFLFVSAGSNGTAAGLGLGLCLAGLKTQIIAVTSTSMSPSDFLEDCKLLYAGMFQLLNIPEPTNLRYPIYDDTYFGKAYADLTPKTAAALRILHLAENVKLDSTYAGKAFGAFLDFALKEEAKDKVLLFWNTFCTSSLEQLGYKILPSGFHHYFTDDLQPGDLGMA